MSGPIGYIVAFPRERPFQPGRLVEELARRGAIVVWRGWDERNSDAPDGMVRSGDDSVLVATTELRRGERSDLVNAHSATFSTSDRDRLASATAKYAVRSPTFEISSLVRLVADVLAQMCDGVAILVTKL